MKTALALMCSGAAAIAAPPAADVLFPAGGQVGTTFRLTAGGKFDPWPAAGWCSERGLRLKPIDGEKGAFELTITPDATPGALLLRFFNADGCSAPRVFVVGEHPETNEAETGGDGAETITRASLPLTINGKLDPGGDVDRFEIDLEQGETLIADIDAYKIGSPIDPLLHVLDSGGSRLAFNHDATGIGLDPRLVFTAPKADSYTLLLFGFTYPPSSSHRFGGSSKAAYRLTLSTGPPQLPPPPAEHEAQRVPFQVEGRIDPPGDTDTYRFTASKGEKLVFEVHAATLASLLDPILRITDGEGKELARKDDIDPKTLHDVALDWVAPADGTFAATISDTAGKGAPGFAYRLEVTHQQPRFEATTTVHSLDIKPGGDAELPVKVTRHYGHTGKLTATARDLPPGVSAAAVDVPEKGELKIVLKAAPDAKPANQPFSIYVGDQRMSVTLKGASTDAGDLLINTADSVWLTVLTAAEE